MPPKRKTQRDEEATPSPDSQPGSKSKRSRPDTEPTAELVKWIDANDSMVDKTLNVAISELFSPLVLPARDAAAPKDFSKLAALLESRSEHSLDKLFIQLKEDSLELEPLPGEAVAAWRNVDYFLVVATPKATLAPAYYLLRQHRRNADLEDCTPERVQPLSNQRVKWIPIVKGDGSGTNSYFLVRPEDFRPKKEIMSRAPSIIGGAPAAASAPALAPSGPSFNFGVAPPAPSAAPSAPPALAPSGPSFNFGFGGPAVSANPVAVAAPLTTAPSFGFGTPAPAAPSAPALTPSPSFNFGAPVAPAASAPTPQRDASMAAFGRGNTIPTIPVKELCFMLWTPARIKELKKDLAAGSRIKKSNVALSDGLTVNIVMQSDTKDKPEKTVDEILQNAYCKMDSTMKQVDDYVEKFPFYMEAAQDHLQKIRAVVMKKQLSDDKAVAFLQKYRGQLLAELQPIVDQRRKEIQEEEEMLNHIQQLLQESKLADKSTFTVFKYFPSNSEVKFRPNGKVSGITGEGENAICFPERYIPKSPFGFR
jgi:hypothetical protein